MISYLEIEEVHTGRQGDMDQCACNGASVPLQLQRFVVLIKRGWASSSRAHDVCGDVCGAEQRCWAQLGRLPVAAAIIHSTSHLLMQWGMHLGSFQP